jgi:hypothetical protein
LPGKTSSRTLPAALASSYPLPSLQDSVSKCFQSLRFWRAVWPHGIWTNKRSIVA